MMNQMKKMMQQTPTRRRLFACGMALALAILLVLVNVLVSLLPWGMRSFSVGREESYYEISAPTKSVLHSLDKDVSLYLVTEDGEVSLDRDLYAFLKSYESLSSHVTIGVISDKANPDFLASRGYDLPARTENSVSAPAGFLVECGDRSRFILMEELYYYECVITSDKEELSMVFTPEEYQAYGRSFLLSGDSGTGTVTAHFAAESGITNAIVYVQSDSTPTVAILKRDTVLDVDAAFINLLWKRNYEVCTISSLSELDVTRHDMLLYNTPLADISADESDALSAYLSDGGDLFLTTYYGRGAFTNLSSVLGEYGLSADEKWVRIVENNKSYSVKSGDMQYLYAKISSTVGATGSFDGIYFTSDVHAIHTTAVEGVTSSSWLYTTENGSRERYDEQTDKATAIEEPENVYAYGVVAERGDSKVIWVSTPWAFSRSYDILANGCNLELMGGAVDWAVGSSAAENTVAIADSPISSPYLMVTRTAFWIFAILICVVIPAAFITVGAIRRYLRHNA